ncbi:MAG TPA: 5-formyltetrahydrofolate cyclo-ligase [Roseiarcus sp.]|nr:5-formyltetrahydrofolate cyclo-ligase [Roseiarcus sp.]
MTTAPAAAKADLREAALARRRALGQADRAKFSARLAREGLRLARRTGARAVSAFHAFPDEPDTGPLLAALAEADFVTLLPITGTRGAPLVFRRWRPGEPTRPGRMNIPEPLEDAPARDPDLLFVPLACFDRRGHRIGFGAGYYDLTLRALRAKGRAVAVGVGYSVAECPILPDEPHDERLDYVLTESELIDCRDS